MTPDKISVIGNVSFTQKHAETETELNLSLFFKLRDNVCGYKTNPGSDAKPVLIQINF